YLHILSFDGLPTARICVCGVPHASALQEPASIHSTAAANDSFLPEHETYVDITIDLALRPPSAVNSALDSFATSDRRPLTAKPTGVGRPVSRRRPRLRLCANKRRPPRYRRRCASPLL